MRNAEIRNAELQCNVVPHELRSDIPHSALYIPHLIHPEYLNPAACSVSAAPSRSTPASTTSPSTSVWSPLGIVATTRHSSQPSASVRMGAPETRAGLVLIPLSSFGQIAAL